MPDKVSKPASGTPAGSTATPAVAGNGTAKQAATPAVTPSAASTATSHGGLRGGKPRKDGLVPGSNDALEADRKADAQRKRDQRTALRQADPPPLPSAGSQVQTPGGGVAAVPGVEGVPPVPWDPVMLKPLFDQLFPTVEKFALKQITSRAEKAHLPGEIIHDIERDAAWNPTAKKAIEIAAPQVAAKWLNKSGVSAEHQPEIVLATAVSSIIGSHILLLRRMDELIKKANPPVEPKPGEKKDPPKS